MSIVSLPFLSVFVFLAIAYFIVPKKLQPYFLLCINIVFYCYAGLTQLLYLCLTILSTYLAARIMETKPQRVKKAILIVTITLNIMILFLVKYLNYIWEICANLNILPEKGVSALIVPLGIAFYTLQAIGYCIDIYRQKYKAESNFLKYALFMSYFPIIMQGPISRFNQLGEQLVQPHSFQYERIKFGIQLMAWGFFKKLVIADRANILVNQVYGNYLEYAGFEIFIASLTYTIQIYTDFSGCVDICRGISQILGIELIQNFDHPYFSRSITEFWRRWHISLSSWLRDYLYIPLGGNRKGVVRKYLNIIVVFFISGIWHGVGFHFILWGLIHGFYQVFGALTKGIRNKAYQCLKVNKSAFSYKLGQVGITFLLVNFAWIFLEETVL